MTFVAKASRVVRLPRKDCFARFVHFPSWSAFMPASFRPLRGPTGDLCVGDRFWISLRVEPARLNLPTVVKVVRVAPGVEVAWRGGAAGLLVGEHAFIFEDEPDGATLIRSEETWRGALTGLGSFARSIRSEAERIGAEQLAGFASWVAG